MRHDMQKVLTERPRYGSRRGYDEVRHRENRGDPGDLPAYQGMRRPYISHHGSDAKEFSDLLGPLKRFLASCTGRPWDDVWSEICQQVDDTSTTGRHLREHVGWEVEREPDAVARIEAGGQSSRSNALLYVDSHGILRRVTGHRRAKWNDGRVQLDGISYLADGDLLVEEASRWEHVRDGRARDLARRVFLHGVREAVRLDGTWYWVVFATVPPPYRGPVTDGKPWSTRPITRECTDFVTRAAVRQGVYRADKRQMASRDLVRHGLRNVAPRARQPGAGR